MQFGTGGDGPGFDGHGRSSAIRRALLEYRWGDDTLRFELQPDGDGTVLTFTDTFDEYGKAARDGAGWHACLDMLGFALDGTKPEPVTTARTGARFIPATSSVSVPKRRRSARPTGHA